MQIGNFGLESEYTKELQKIKQWAKSLRNLREKKETTWTEPVDWEVKGANINGESVVSLTITLTPSGCAWASTGGCTMCGEYEGSTKGEMVSDAFHISQFAVALATYVEKYNPKWLRIYQEGNYINNDEVTLNAQVVILKLASMIKGIKRITIECMAKYITEEKAALLRSAVAKDVELEIGMGFEAADDIVRNICVNKGETINDYIRALKILRANNVRSLAYVLLKPPFLTEAEAIEEAIKTTNYANEIGFDAVSLQPVTIHKYSLVHALYTIREYELPWLWSIIEVVNNINKNVEDFRIGGLGFYPRPVSAAYNRHIYEGDCNRKIWEAIKEYGKYRNKDIFKNLDCRCRYDWEKYCREGEDTLKNRINYKLDRLTIENYKQFLADNLNEVRSDINYISIAGDTQV
jgi:hypothetical protein